MEKEKKVIKISLGKFIAIVIAIIIILFIGINFLAYKMEKPNLISSIEALIKNDDEEVLNKTARDLFEKAMVSIRDPYNFYKSADVDTEKIEGQYYRKTDATYEEVKAQYKEIFTDDIVENVMKLNFYNKDGIMYSLERAGGTPWTLIELRVEKINEENGELTYNAVYKLSYTDDPSYKQPEERECQFKMKEENGVYKICATNYLNIDIIILENDVDLDLAVEEAKKIIQGYFNIIGAKNGSPANVLSTDEINMVDKNSEIPGGDYIDKQNYRRSNIKFNDFKNKMLEYMNEEEFNSLSEDVYKDVDGFLYIFDGGASGMNYEIEGLKLILSNSNEYQYEVVGIVYPPEEGEIFTAKVVLQKNSNNKYVVSSMELQASEVEQKPVENTNNETTTNNNSTTNNQQNNESNNEDNSEELGWKAFDLNEKIIAKSYEHKYVTIEFDKDVFDYLQEDEKKYNIKTGVEYKLVNYEGEIKELRRINGRGAWPVIILINDEGKIYLGNTGTMEYNNNNHTAKLEPCSIGYVKEITKQYNEYVLNLLLKSEFQYNITLSTMTDEELIEKVKQYSEDNFNFEIENINSLVRTPETWINDGQTIGENFVIMFTVGEQIGTIRGSVYSGSGELCLVKLNKI